MNFQLKVPSKKKKKKVAKSTPKNVFGDGDGSDEDNNNQQSSGGDGASSQRDNVNRAIQKEQEAMRRRAEETMKRVAQETTGNIYDYDANYESQEAAKKKAKEQQQSAGQEKGGERKSRYIGDLLKASKERNYERDVAYERKMAREQEQEEQDNVELQGKERFVTAGYKRKLEERKLWKENRDRLDEQDDAARRDADNQNGMANFYGNFSKNVAMGASAKGPAGEEPPAPSFVEGFERADNTEDKEQGTKAPPADMNPEEARREQRRLREEKVAAARERYFKRHPEAKAT